MLPDRRSMAVLSVFLAASTTAFQSERLTRTNPMTPPSSRTNPRHWTQSDRQPADDVVVAARTSAEQANSRSRRELEKLAIECNPRIRFFDPLGLASKSFWGTSEMATISFLQHAEMKHGRVAMLAFVGYCVQANHIHWFWATPENGFPPSELTPPEQWEVLNPISKLQIFLFIALLEIWSEAAGIHYMKPGGKAGFFPPFEFADGFRVPFVLDLWDPLKITTEMTPSLRRRKLAKEINNGRLAMLGLLSFFVESKTPGAIPFLAWAHVVEPYDGQYLLPFSYWDVVIYYSERVASATHTPALVPW